MSVKGPSRYRQTRTWKEQAMLIKIHKGEEIKQRKQRAIETRPREQPELQLRADAVKWFKKHGWRYWRIENSIIGKSSGLADFLVAKRKMIFVELKGTGNLTGFQPEFRDWCKKCNMPYVVARSVEDLDVLELIK